MRSLPKSVAGLSLLLPLLCAVSGVPEPTEANAKARFERLMQTTPAYQQEALERILAEANQVAAALQLPEPLPIRETNVIRTYITPPRMGRGMGAIGNITTSNYTYYVSVGSKLSFIERYFADVTAKDYLQLKSEYRWPMSQLDTNAAFQLATQFLARASMDVKALNRDSIVTVDAYTPEGKAGKHFVPLYWVTWKRKGEPGPAATVELLLPTKNLRQLRVHEAEYILRPPVKFEDLDALLSPTNAPAAR